MKGGDLGDRKLLGAAIRTELERGESFADALGFGERPQVVHQGFALLRETQFHKTEELGFVSEGELGAFAGQAERDESRGHFRRRAEGVAGDFKDNFGARVELGDDRKIAVFTRARRGGEASGDFRLNHEVHFVEEVREGEQVMQDRRSDVVRKIAVNANAAAGSDGGDVRFEDVAGDDGEIGEFLREAAESSDEFWVEFDGVNGSAGGEEVLGHFAVTGTDFDPTVLVAPMHRGLQRRLVPRQRNDGMRRNTDGAGDLFAQLKVTEEVLAETLACHGSNSVAGGAGSAARGKEARK